MSITKSTLLLFALGVLFFAASPRAISASFNCGKATSATEKLICKDPKTSALDEKLQQTYKAALAAAAPSSKKALIEEQRHWITYTRNVCQDENCLQRAYADRISILATNQEYIVNRSECTIPDGTSCRSVVYYRDPNSRIKSFNQTLIEQKKPGRIIGCTKLIDLPVGYAGSNNSFGGVCKMQNGATRTTVEICNDDMFGHFSMQTALPDLSDKDLIEFTNSHCFGS